MLAAMIAADINRDPSAQMAVAIAASIMENTIDSIDVKNLPR